MRPSEPRVRNTAFVSDALGGESPMKTRAEAPPVAPREPLPEECCGKGCTPCVLDTYAEALQKYQVALQSWRERQQKAPR